MKIIILYRCIWCRRFQDAELVIANPNPKTEIHLLADEYRTCPSCRARVYEHGKTAADDNTHGGL